MTARNIIVVGATNSGKSALCNVLTGTDKFKEGGYGVSETFDAQEERFYFNGMEYCVADTAGVGNTRQNTKEVMDIITRQLRSMSGRVWQILLVTDGRFSREEIEIYKSVISKFKNQVIIVRTKFDYFRNEDKCNNDRDAMLKNKEIAKIIKRCKVIHVSNPPIDVKGDSNDDSEDIILQNSINRKARDRSRDILLDYFKGLK